MDFKVEDTYGLVLDLVRSNVDLVSGMIRLLAHCSRLCPSPAWDEIASLDFASDAVYLKRWLHDLLQSEPPGENIVAFWFGLFDRSSPGGAFACLYLSGAESYTSGDTDSGWACGPAYFPDGRNADSGALRSLSAMLRSLDEDAAWLGSYVLPLGYASLAVAQALGQLPPGLLLGRRNSRAVAVGFDSGDFITLPEIKA